MSNDQTNALSPFDFIKSISETKTNLIVDQWSENRYQPFIVNKGLSFSPDTVILANEINSRPHLDKTLQYSFLINIVRPRKRYIKWMKSSKIEALEVVKEFYNYNSEKARQVLNILTDEQINTLKEKLKKGGVNDK